MRDAPIENQYLFTDARVAYNVPEVILKTLKQYKNDQKYNVEDFMFL